MKDILFLVWYEKENNVLNLIAKLTLDNGLYTFEYLNFDTSDLQLFSKNGLFYGFEDINQIYCSTSLFSSIAGRLPSKKRVDYDKIMKDLHLEHDANEFEILKKTKGILSTDHFIFVTKEEYEELKKGVEIS